MTILSRLQDSFVPHMPTKDGLRDLRHNHGSAVAPLNLEKQLEKALTEQQQHNQENDSLNSDNLDISSTNSGSKIHVYDATHRNLKNRHIQLIGIGATIGTALFVAIGSGLYKGGPLGLFLAFVVWSIPILCITCSIAEMVSYLPISSPFIRMAGRCVDEPFEIMAGWNFWFLQCSQIPFEVTAVNSIIHFWRDDYSPGIPLAVQVALYFIISVFGVKIFGETEFWLAIGKVVLAVGLMIFTFVTMVGGNPQHDAFGFRYWRDPGPLNEYLYPGARGRWMGIVACFIRAAFTIAGPEYISMCAGETANPRKSLPRAFKQVFWRLSLFFIVGALCVGILVAHNDPALVEAIKMSKPGAASSPYVIAMTNMNIKVLPHIVNALIVTSCFSAGNSYTYCSSRTLYGMALDGRAPRFLTAVTNTGVPLWCVLISLIWALLSFLQLGENASVVLNWIINLVTASQLINFCIMMVTYIAFFNAMKAQGINRDELPFKGWWQPYQAYVGLVCAFIMTFVSGYEVFLPGEWDYQTFLFSYIMVFVNIAIYVVAKVIKGMLFIKAADADLVTGLAEIEEHEMIFYQMEEERALAHAELRERSGIKGKLVDGWLYTSKILFGA
ncbi:hypothetical protein BABINDRAFT_163205 [Babjeviella inositovora NRRL Y-12698]|uniref:Amino acid permease/ SLC12A domain-containing protein n=1 Tax=Babjeviella inositovora NRRL Y-12698 TaxID=984486 RepID=A0A1E3QLF0_9ASCO|nr:uncharacterized protein BABINDRAFT_163205 [Babjeviella inositovora NRRL Y-12698]ODQ77817.1 hypothetical protein BABINDRAFT_163205 [Babjeviella inositovora NRRL Y-12698]